MSIAIVWLSGCSRGHVLAGSSPAPLLDAVLLSGSGFRVAIVIGFPWVAFGALAGLAVAAWSQVRRS